MTGASPAPERFTIAVPDAVLADLAERLARTRLPTEVDGAGWRYGTDQGALRTLIDHWQRGFDWRAAEASLNALDQYVVELDGLVIHFVHVRGRGPDPVPLLFVHGWPGSFWEVHKVIGPLVDPAAHGGDPADAFDVIAPSLPGYGFSPDPGRAGVDVFAMADLFDRLVHDVLGYETFGLQGGDWGGLITTAIARRHPSHVLGLHLNGMGARKRFAADEVADADTRAAIAASRTWFDAEGGYQAIQRTKPQSLAYALNDSPAGLAAWILEKFTAWSDCGGDPFTRFTIDELLTNITIYWVTGSIGSSMRLYHEQLHGGRSHGVELAPDERIEVPTAFSSFPAEIARPSRQLVDRAYSLRQWREHPSGGHFAALEEPGSLVTDVRDFFRVLRTSTEPAS
jgi:epoxide hydrolase